MSDDQPVRPEAEGLLYGNPSRGPLKAPIEQIDQAGDGRIEHYSDGRLIKIEIPPGYQGSAPANADGAKLWLRTSVATTLHYDGDGNLHREDGPAVSYSKPIRIGLTRIKGVYWLRGHQLGSRKREWKRALDGTHKYYGDQLARTN